ncbi:MAG: deoxyuridine 5'-triphosphate nucleotidohydrolase [Flavobacteriales bacterium]|nr:deoxyuridine 5'-triphosphate nucleotidohydrolase [Flavobacteriales bacterium]
MHKYQSILKANIKNEIFINSLERKLITTGYYLEFNKIFYNNFFIRKKLIDAGIICLVHFYEKKEKKIVFQELQLVIINISLKIIKIKPKEKIAIIDIYPKIKIKWEESSILNKSGRGNNSFGSTGYR